MWIATRQPLTSLIFRYQSISLLKIYLTGRQIRSSSICMKHTRNCYVVVLLTCHSYTPDQVIHSYLTRHNFGLFMRKLSKQSHLYVSRFIHSRPVQQRVSTLVESFKRHQSVAAKFDYASSSLLCCILRPLLRRRGVTKAAGGTSRFGWSGTSCCLIQGEFKYN